MSTNREIERKFLVQWLPKDFAQLPYSEIEQGYLALDSKQGVEVRLRTVDGVRQMTVKTWLAIGTRIEREITLDPQQFAELWPATAGRRLWKTRYSLPWGNLTIQVDVYAGPAAGLIVAEIEFPDETSRIGFRKPDWLGEDISGVYKYSNPFLATG